MSLGGLGGLWSILLVLVGGWLSLQSRFFETLTWSESGYNLYFRIAVAGLLCFLVGLAAIAPYILSSALASSCSGEQGERLSAFFVVFYQCHEVIFAISSWASLFVGMFVWAASIPLAWTKKHPLLWMVKRRINKILEKNEFERLVMHSIKAETLLLVTMDSRKSYVGLPADTFDLGHPDTAKKYLRILPLLSGHRNSFDMDFVITRDYLEVLSDDSPEDEEKWRNLEIVIPVDKITSLQQFDLDLYDIFQQKNPTQKIKDPPPPRNSAPPPG